MEDVVIALTRWAGPDVGLGVPKLLDILQVANQNLMVHRCSQLSRTEEVNTVQVGDVHSPAAEVQSVTKTLMAFTIANSITTFALNFIIYAALVN